MTIKRLEELEGIVSALASNSQAIQMQLGQGGAPEWRRKAKAALFHVNEKLRKARAELKSLRRERNERVVAARGIDVRDADALIAHAYQLLHRLVCDGVEIDPQEQAVIDGLRHYLQHVDVDAIAAAGPKS